MVPPAPAAATSSCSLDEQQATGKRKSSRLSHKEEKKSNASTTPSDPSSRADERVPLDAKFLPDKASYSLNNYILNSPDVPTERDTMPAPAPAARTKGSADTANSPSSASVELSRALAESSLGPTSPSAPSSHISTTSSHLSTPTKPLSGSLTTSRSRSGDEPALGHAWFDGMIVATSPSDLFLATGSRQGHFEALSSKAATYFATREGGIFAQELPTLFKAESGRDGLKRDPKSKWFRRLGAAANDPLAPPLKPPFAFRATPAEPLQGARAHLHARKPDGALAYSTKAKVRMGHLVVLVEWTITSENVSSKLHTKLRQAIFNASDLLAEQPERLYVLTLVICEDKAYFVMLDAECIRIATIDLCWTTGVASLAAIAHYILNIDLISAGFSPMFEYEYDSMEGIRPLTFTPSFDLIVSEILPSTYRLKLVHSPYPRHSSFSRATTIYAAMDSTGGAPLMVKIQKVANTRTRREPVVQEALGAADLPEKDKTLLSNLVASLAFDTLPYQSSLLPFSAQARHLEVLFMENKPATIACRLDDKQEPPLVFDVLTIVRQLLLLLISLWTIARVLHRDLSPANVLRKGRLLALIDWDCGIRLRAGERSKAAAGTRTGTLETMAREVLDGPVQHKLRHDLESVLYLLWYWLWSGLERSSEGEEKKYWGRWRFGEERVTSSDIRAARGQIWDPPNKRMAHSALKAFSPALATMMKGLMQTDPSTIDDDDDDDEQEAVELAFKLAAIIDSALEEIKQDSSSSPSWLDTRWWKTRG